MTNTNPIDYNKITSYFGQKLAKFGPTVRGIDWNSEDAQVIRFQQVCKVINSTRAFSINDYGCGYGALIDFLRQHDFSFRYTGFDLLKPMVAAGQEKYGDNPAITFTSDEALLPVADYTVLSGVFNVKQDASESAWTQYMFDILQRVNQISARGFAFNALTSYSDPDRMRPDLYYADPCVLFDYCKRHFSKNVALLHDYHLYDFTIIVRKTID